MAWMPAPICRGGVHGRLLGKGHWLPCVRAASSRPTPSLSLPPSEDGEPGSRRALAAFFKKQRYRPEPVPERLARSIREAVSDFPAADLERDAQALRHRLAARHPPAEDADLQATAQRLEQEFVARHGAASEQRVRQHVIRQLKARVYHWRPLEVDSPYAAAVHLTARFAADYAALLFCLRQPVAAAAAAAPVAVLNLGSGAGAALWAARRLWGGAVREFVGVERRQQLQELAALLAQGGRPDGAADPGVFLRPLLPTSRRLQYPLVVSSHALLELGSQRERLEAVTALWERTAPGGRLTLLETGNNAGYLLVMEARDLLLRLAASDGAPAHVEAPCPHDAACPRFSHSLTPCHFSVPYYPLVLSGAAEPAVARTRVSFVTVRKAPRPAEDEQRPRVVQPVLVRSQHVICRLCTNRGKLEEIVVTKRRHGSDLYQCARAAQWGDTLPVTL